jgi:hypothetical protein
MTLLREYTAALYALLQGDTVTTHGAMSTSMRSPSTGSLLWCRRFSSAGSGRGPYRWLASCPMA